MKSNRNRLAALIAGAFTIAALASCGNLGSSSSRGKGSAELMFTASSTSNPNALMAPGEGTAALVIAPLGVTVTEYRIALADIEFERNGEDMNDESDNPEFEGPFYIDLLNPAGILAQTLGEIEIPAGTYKGIEFDMHKGNDANTPTVLVNRSVYLAGSWNDSGTIRLFEIWHDTSEEFFITGPNGITVGSSATGNSLIVDFNIDDILAGIDFTLATFDPANDDFLGDYAISPGSTQSANQDLADIIKNNLEAAAEFGEDDDGDGDLGDNEDTDDDGDEDGDGIDDDEEDETEDDDGIGDEDGDGIDDEDQ